MNNEQSYRTLVVECASEACSVALFEAGIVIANQHLVLGRGHAEKLVPLIAGLPDKGRAGRILTSVGPGSFTGVRIGIATARALGIAWGSTVLGYPTLGQVAATCAQQHGKQAVTVCMKGGHGEWFVQNFAEDLMPQDAVQSVTPDQAIALARHRRIAGSRACDLAQLRGDDCEVFDLLPNAASAHFLPDSQLSADLTPIYGREPDAKLPSARKAPA